jgi:hypothetical protein
MKTKKLIKELFLANLKHNIEKAKKLRRKLFKKSLEGKHTELAD